MGTGDDTGALGTTELADFGDPVSDEGVGLVAPGKPGEVDGGCVDASLGEAVARVVTGVGAPGVAAFVVAAPGVVVAVVVAVPGDVGAGSKGLGDGLGGRGRPAERVGSRSGTDEVGAVAGSTEGEEGDAVVGARCVVGVVSVCRVGVPEAPGIAVPGCGAVRVAVRVPGSVPAEWDGGCSGIDGEPRAVVVLVRDDRGDADAGSVSAAALSP